MFRFGKIFQIFPQLQNILKVLCALYLIYLGFKIIGSFSKIKEDNSRPLKFYEAALFQIINPKAWTISSMAASSFLSTSENLIIANFLHWYCCFNYMPNINISLGCFWLCIKSIVNNNKVKVIIEFFFSIFAFNYSHFDCNRQIIYYYCIKKIETYCDHS